MRCTFFLAVLILLLSGSGAMAADFCFRERPMDDLVRQVPQILRTYEPATGHFGSGIWNCRDQHPMYALAVAYTTAGQRNPYHKDHKLLEVIVGAGDALIAAMDSQGRWEFRKKDGSTWGWTHTCWTYSRWIRTFGLIREDMPAPRRQAWARALTLGYTQIARSGLERVHNIPAHHAMGLYAAGKILEQPQWCAQAKEFLHTIAAAQAPGGYWSEGGGPLILYNFDYVEAIGTYYGMSSDPAVLPALQNAAQYHSEFTYPDGACVETIDQRNYFQKKIEPGNVGLTFSSQGRAFLFSQWQRLQWKLDADLIAALLQYGQEGPVPAVSSTRQDRQFVLLDHDQPRAITVRKGPWFVCMSAFTSPISKSRWHQDRQNLVSIWHDKVGLILGGGNTKLQPAWSTFTLGDETALVHRSGDTNPDFLPKGRLFHIPDAGILRPGPPAALDLTYGNERCRVTVEPKDPCALVYTIEREHRCDLPATAHLTLLPRLDHVLATRGGFSEKLSSRPIRLTAEQVGREIRHSGFVLQVPGSATLHWPALPHNPYRADGHADLCDGRIEIRLPLSSTEDIHRITIRVEGGAETAD